MADEMLTRKTAHELAALIKSRAVSPVEVLDAHLAVIERVNPKLNAIVTLAVEAARASARAAEDAVIRGEALGPLHGLPIGVKDVTPTAGIRTTYGSRLYADHVPDHDAEIVRRLKAAGAIVIGKTNTPEFAAGANTVNEVFGATRNPWNVKLSVGGSTGGGAAGLAAGMFPLAEGTDFGGSLRVPAAFCGVVGLRPTPGLTPLYPTALPWDTLRVSGPMARTAEDVALMLSAVGGPFDKSPISLPSSVADLPERVRSISAKDLRIGYVSDISGVGVESEIDAVCRKAARNFEAAGARVEETTLDLSEGRMAFPVLRGMAVVLTHRNRLDKIDHMGKNLAGNIRSGQALTTEQVLNAEAARAQLWQRTNEFFSRYDVLLTPCVPVAPFPVEQSHPENIGGRAMNSYIDWIAPTFVLTLVSVPAASVPAGLDSRGLPVGLQIVCPRFQEATVLGLARILQERIPMPAVPIEA
jgi:amidase